MGWRYDEPRHAGPRVGVLPRFCLWWWRVAASLRPSRLGVLLVSVQLWQLVLQPQGWQQRPQLHVQRQALQPQELQ